MLQCQSNWVTGNLGVTERQILSDAEQGLKMNVRLHSNNDGGSGGLHVRLSVSADQDEWVVDGAGGGHDDDVPQEVGGRHLDEDVVHPFPGPPRLRPVVYPRFITRGLYHLSVALSQLANCITS